jgi:hypothetical protein
MNMLSKTKKRIDDETEHEEEKTETKPVATLIVPKDDDMRLIGLFGEVEEQKVAVEFVRCENSRLELLSPTSSLSSFLTQLRSSTFRTSWFLASF